MVDIEVLGNEPGVRGFMSRSIAPPTRELIEALGLLPAPPETAEQEKKRTAAELREAVEEAIRLGYGQGGPPPSELDPEVVTILGDALESVGRTGPQLAAPG
jgi:hypothetical protein